MQKDRERDFEQLIALFQNARYCVVFTGAGISTLSGIPDFRGRNGLYRTLDAGRIFDLDQFNRDPSFYYGMAKDVLYGTGDFAPSLVHTVLARLESRGIVRSIITQNIDLLHTRAGSKRVLEIHGSLANHQCSLGHPGLAFDEVVATVQAGRVPHCRVCDRVLKPGVTFFGEALPAAAMEAAFEEAGKADLMLVLGTTLVVEPAASLPRVTLAHHGEIVIVNKGVTPLDRSAALLFDDLEWVFTRLSAHFADAKLA